MMVKKIKPGNQIDDFAAYIPTRKEIRAACLEFQKKWSPTERKKRSSGFDLEGTGDTVEVTRSTYDAELYKHKD